MKKIEEAPTEVGTDEYRRYAEKMTPGLTWKVIKKVIKDKKNAKTSV